MQADAAKGQAQAAPVMLVRRLREARQMQGIVCDSLQAEAGWQGTQAYRRDAIRCQSQAKGRRDVQPDMLVRQVREADASSRVVQRTLPATTSGRGTEAVDSQCQSREQASQGQGNERRVCGHVVQKGGCEAWTLAYKRLERLSFHIERPREERNGNGLADVRGTSTRQGRDRILASDAGIARATAGRFAGATASGAGIDRFRYQRRADSRA